MAAGWAQIETALSKRAPTRVSEDVRARAAVALVLQDGPAGLELLFIRRSDHPQDPWSGQMAFPGGRQDPEDGALVDTAVRETLEEVGIDLVADATLLGTLDEVRAMARQQPLSLAIRPHLFRLARPVQPRPNEEVRSIHWLPLERLLDAALRSTHAYAHEGITMRFPCLRDGDIVIWGLTFRMFEDLAERLGTPVREPRPATA
jgi:8-oxo-dGTP pyrophosphatase MutT (NUDIX family)